jgi:hypothetical protein
MNCKTQVLGRFRIFSFLSFVVLCGCLMGGGQLAVAQSDPCNSPTVGAPATSVGTDTEGRCSAVITVTAVDNAGNAIAFNVSVTEVPPYDGAEDILVGVQNDSGANLTSMKLSSPDITDKGIFAFDFDGPCSLNATLCFHGAQQQQSPGDYQGPENTFTVDPGTPCTVNNMSTMCFTSGTVNFNFSAIPAGGRTWFALEGSPQALAATGQTVTQLLNPTENDFNFTSTGDTAHPTIQKIIYSNSGTDPSGTTMQVTFRPISPTQFQNLVAGTFAQGSSCIPQEISLNSFACAVTIALCKGPDDTSFTGQHCPQASAAATSIIGVDMKYFTNKFDLPTSVPNPGYLAATDNALDCGPDLDNTCRQLHNIFTGIADDCCTTSGGTKSFNSLFVPVSGTYFFTGFFQPVDNLPVVNMVKAGSAVPIKFSLGANFGLNILTVGSPGSGPIPCSSTDPVDTIETTVTAGNSSLSYDPTSNQYTYVWKTQSAWANTCRQLVVSFADGTTQRANFKFKK